MESVSVTKPTSYANFTQESNATVVFSKIPTFEFLIQRFSIPGISLGTVDLYGRTGMFSRPGEMLRFEKPLVLEIIMDEGYVAFQEILDWLELIAGSDDPVERDLSKYTTDARIVILDNNGKGVGAVNFHHVYPTGISSIQYAITNSGVTYVKFSATFDYSIYKFDKGYESLCSVHD